MTSERDGRGRFVKGNKIRKKPVICPFCNNKVKIISYYYLAKEDEDMPLVNGLKHTNKLGGDKNEDRGFEEFPEQEN